MGGCVDGDQDTHTFGYGEPFDRNCFRCLAKDSAKKKKKSSGNHAHLKRQLIWQKAGLLVTNQINPAEYRSTGIKAHSDAKQQQQQQKQLYWLPSRLTLQKTGLLVTRQTVVDSAEKAYWSISRLTPN